MAAIKPPDVDDKDPTAKHDWFYMWIGLCLTRWGFVNEALYSLCHLTLATDAKRAAIVFYKTPTFETRLTLVTELIVATLPERKRKDGGHDHPLVSEWEGIRNRLLDLSPVRNVLAHQHVSSYSNSLVSSGEEPPSDYYNWLEIGLAESEALRDRKPKVTSVKDTELPKHFHDLLEALRQLSVFQGKMVEELQKLRARQPQQRSPSG